MVKSKNYFLKNKKKFTVSSLQLAVPKNNPETSGCDFVVFRACPTEGRHPR